MADVIPSAVNDLLVLIGGKSATGKSASLRKIENPEGVLYLNCEAGKKLPFRSKFIEKTILDPHDVLQGLDWAETKPHIHTVIIDTLTYLMDMYETIYIHNSTNGMKAWGDFAQYFKTLMQQKVSASTKTVIFLAHTADTLNEAEAVMETKVPVKGALKNTGIESYFSLVISTKKVKLKELKEYSNTMLTITPQDEALGYKHVFQTQPTKDTVNERIRGPMGMWEYNETYIDNDVAHVINRLREYYGSTA